LTAARVEDLPGAVRLFGFALGILAVVIVAGMPLPVCAQIGESGWTVQTPAFNVQWPYNLAESDRYAYDPTTGVYHMWVLTTDDPFKAGSTTLPRTEQRFTPDYTSGEIQYQALLMGDPAENSYSIFQIHTGDAQSAQYGSTTFMLFWFASDGGSVHDYSGQELEGNLGSNWFQLNVDHNLVTRTITVWINGSQVWQQEDNGAGDFYMKDGVYEQNHSPTNQMDAWVKDIHFWTSSGTESANFAVAASPGTMTVAAGQSAQTTITVTPQEGFADAVSFACSGLPAGASCSFSPKTVSPSGTPANTTLTVSDSGSFWAPRSGMGPLIPGAALAGLVCLVGWKRWRRESLVALAVCAAGLGLVSGCSGGGSGGSNTTQTATSTVTVTATSGTLSHTASFSLTVK
jgi:Alginate lyase